MPKERLRETGEFLTALESISEWSTLQRSSFQQPYTLPAMVSSLAIREGGTPPARDGCARGLHKLEVRIAPSWQDVDIKVAEAVVDGVEAKKGERAAVRVPCVAISQQFTLHVQLNAVFVFICSAVSSG